MAKASKAGRRAGGVIAAALASISMSTFGRRVPSPLHRPARYVYRRAKRAGRQVLGRSDSWWDDQPPEVLEVFLQDEVEGVDHPSRRYVRDWLTSHPGLTILDIPCGPGVEYDGIMAAGVPTSYIGMDASDRMLEVVRKRHPDGDFRKGDITDIPLGSGVVDVVLCRHVLEHLDDYRPAVDEAVRVARHRVFLVLFRDPTHSERRQIALNNWDNRLAWSELAAHLDSLGFPYTRTQIPYGRPASQEENVVVEIDVSGRNAQ